MDQKANDISLSGVSSIDSSHKTSVSNIGEESPANQETHGEIQKVALRTLTDSTMHSRSSNEATQQSRAASPTEVDLPQVSTAPLLSSMPFSQAKAIELESEKPMAQETQATAFPHLEEELARILAQTLYMEESEVDIEKPFKDMGMDSIIAVELTQSINKQYAINLKATSVYDYPTIRQLASFLQKDLLMRGGAIQQTPAESPSPLSLDEVLQQVQQRNLDPQEAEQLLRQFEELR